jgi:hypothetical protein
VAVSDAGAPVLASDRTDLTQESLSTNWSGNVRTSVIDAHAFSGGITIAGSVVGSLKSGDPVGDILVLADYVVGSNPLSASASTVLQFTLPGGAALGSTPIFRQMLFSDHAVLLSGDDSSLRAYYVTR